LRLTYEGIKLDFLFKHNPFGAQLLQAGSLGQAPWLYCSPLPSIPGQPVRGGVPVLFPQFANKGPLPKHGFVRNLVWEQQDTWQTDTESGVIYALDLDEQTVPVWPHKASLKLEISASSGRLFMRLVVTNKGTDTIEWTGGLHPYWWVQNLLDTKVVGLGAKHQNEMIFDENGVEQIFPNKGTATLMRGKDSAIELQASGFDEWMVWNPGHVGAKLLADMPAEDWQNFVCIEPVCVTNPVRLEAGESFEGILQAKIMGL
jgi:glucose-6-phosphate 1-epimerase